jgi:hypothetical protein
MGGDNCTRRTDESAFREDPVIYMYCPGHQPPEDMHEQNLEEILKY